MTMKSEQEAIHHKWWHRLFSREMGNFTWVLMDNHTGEMRRIMRAVRYCRICREDIHDGSKVDVSLGMIPRKASGPRPENVIPFQPDDKQAWPIPPPDTNA